MRGGLVRLAGFVVLSLLCVGQGVSEPNPNARSLSPDGSRATPPFSGQSTAIIYDIPTGTQTPVSLVGDDPRLADYGTPPINGVRFDFPVIPGDPSFPRLEFDDGATFCSATVIGPRHLLTAGHCVFDGGRFRHSAIAYPGYTSGKASPDFGQLVARRLIAFSGWTLGQDFAHDIAMVELDRDLPSSVRRYTIDQTRPNCQIPNGFERHFYVEGANNQIKNGSLVHSGCKNGQLFFFLGTGHGSSGSSAVSPGTSRVYAVRSNFVGDVGYDAWITSAKRCFLRGRIGSSTC